MTFNVRNGLSDGVYNITNMDNSTMIPVYCVFDYSNDYSWTLIESGSRSQMENSTGLRYASFRLNISFNEDNVDLHKDTIYRMSDYWINSIKSRSEFLLSTCNFNTSLAIDYMLFNLSNTEYDIFQDRFTSVCISVESANIIGYSSDNCTTKTIQMWDYDVINSDFHVHLEASAVDCGCHPWPSSSNHDCFGWYTHYDTTFTCTTTSENTTNWWLGSKITEYNTRDPTEIPTIQPTKLPTNVPSDQPTMLPTDMPSNQPSGLPSDMPTMLPSSDPSTYPSISPTYSSSMNINYNTTTILSSSHSTEYSTSIDGSNGNNNNGSNSGITNENIVWVLVICVLFLLCCLGCFLMACTARYYIDRKFRFESQQNTHFSDINGNTGHVKMRSDTLEPMDSASFDGTTANDTSSNMILSLGDSGTRTKGGKHQHNEQLQNVNVELQSVQQAKINKTGINSNQVGEMIEHDNVDHVDVDADADGENQRQLDESQSGNSDIYQLPESQNTKMSPGLQLEDQEGGKVTGIYDK